MSRAYSVDSEDDAGNGASVMEQMSLRSGKVERSLRRWPALGSITDGASTISTMLWQVDARDRASLVEQITSSMRGALASGELVAGERLPPARELAEVLGVHANTVLAAYRVARDEGIVEFRRGRGVRVVESAVPRAAVVDAARAYLEEGRRHGWNVDDLAGLLEELS